MKGMCLCVFQGLVLLVCQPVELVPMSGIMRVLISLLLTCCDLSQSSPLSEPYFLVRKKR